MKKNGKYFLPPAKDGNDFKELFKRLAAAGAGRPIDSDGFPEGPWTADLLADAITQIDSNGSGVDLRTVQLWFQDNDKGVSTENIRWLARIFGCDDPEMTSEWQAVISAAQSRLTARRRERKRNGRSNASDIQELATSQSASNDATGAKRHLQLARTSEALFSHRSLLDLPIIVFAGAVTLGFLAYIAGVHHVTYSPVAGLEKQVGFIWAPNWTIEGLVLLPLFLIVVTQLLKFWKEERSSALRLGDLEVLDDSGWMRKVESFSIAFWVIFLACLLIVCVLQWTATYLSAFVTGNAKNAMIDWILVAVVRPDVVSIPEALVLSILAFLYSGMIYWFYLIGLLLMFIMANDFCEVFRSLGRQSSDAKRLKALEVGTEMMCAIFRCTVFGILIAMCIKLNIAFLLSDGADIVSWLINDALSAVGMREVEAGWLDASALPYFTSFLLVMLTCFVFFASLTQIYWVLDLPATSNPTSHIGESQNAVCPFKLAKASWTKMVGVVALLVVSFLLIGQFIGFSILLTGSVLVAIYSLFQRASVAAGSQIKLDDTK
ncbi:MAG: RcgA family putative transporter [Pikeienuella sp.]